MKKLDQRERAWVILQTPRLVCATARQFDDPYSCITNTRIAYGVLKFLNIPARPYLCFVDIGNEKYCELFWVKPGKGPPQTKEEAERWKALGAHAILIGRNPDGAKPGRFNGHLVLIADNSFYLDCALQQAHRPAKGIIVTEPLIRPIPRADPILIGKPSMVIGPARLPMAVMPNPEARGYGGATYEETPGWRSPEYQIIAEEIAKSLKKEILRRRKAASLTR